MFIASRIYVRGLFYFYREMADKFEVSFTKKIRYCGKVESMTAWTGCCSNLMLRRYFNEKATVLWVFDA